MFRIVFIINMILRTVTPFTSDDVSPDDMYAGSEKGKDGFVIKCPYHKKYQKIDGTCNNYANPKSGSTFMPLRRLLPPDYGDGFQAPRKSKSNVDLPNSRMISSTLKDAGVEHVNSNSLSHMFTQLGQFLAHDAVNTQLEQEPDKSEVSCDCKSIRPECLKIDVPEDDHAFRSKRSCIPLVRSAAYNGTSFAGSPRQQFNTITAFWDGNTVYGSDDFLMTELRDRDSGELVAAKGPDGAKTNSLPLLGQISEIKAKSFACPAHMHPNKSTCFAAGETRVNENLGLICMHAVFMREHNRIAGALKTLNPHWTANDTFWETRKIIGAIIQKITYGEYLPLLVGNDNMGKYDMNVLQNGFYYGYGGTYDASIFNVWATAAFRFGHSMVKTDVSQLDPQYNPVSHTIGIQETLFDPNLLLNGSDIKDSNLIRGLLTDPSENMDIDMNEGLRSMLFESETRPGLDLLAINIQRGREHGLPGYNQYRDYCGLRKAMEFDDLSEEIAKEKIDLLSSIYRHVDDIDIYVGGLIETPLRGAAVGPTFACLNSEQFRALKKGDMSWFENPGSFSYDQLQELRKATLSSLLCNNLADMKMIQPNSLLLESVTDNSRINCNDIPSMDLTRWKDSVSSYEETGSWSRWFPKDKHQSVQDLLGLELKRHPDQLCRGPLRYEKEYIDMQKLKVRFLCPNGEISFSTMPESVEGYTWTRWMDRDTPRLSKGNDFESVDRLVAENPQDMCTSPIAIQAKTLPLNIGLNANDTVEHFSPTGGLICLGDYQKSGSCSDYAVRFLCPDDFFETQRQLMLERLDTDQHWTDWINVDTGVGRGDFESVALARHLGVPVCKRPTRIDGRLAASPHVSATDTNDVLKRFSALFGLECHNEDQANGLCHDYEVRYLCPSKR